MRHLFLWQAAVEVPDLEWAMGIELVEEAWGESTVRHQNLRQSDVENSKIQFVRKDLMAYEADELPNASHVYVFAAGMPPELQHHLCRLLCKQSGIEKVAVVIDGQTGRGKTSLSTLLSKSSCYEMLPDLKMHGIMRGSGSGKTVVMFSRAE